MDLNDNVSAVVVVGASGMGEATVRVLRKNAVMISSGRGTYYTPSDEAANPPL